ncbi:tRNA (adenosine(37)-N6)-threonylcarbamoyltransferase complex ATPase subunit type 1 TsaE [beta proteobacterium MWH-UniP1]
MSQNHKPLLQEDFPSVDEDQAAAIARTTAELVRQTIAAQPAVNSGFRILLHGGLGAGKTTWTRHFLQALGVTGRIKSPSFSVVETYALDGLQAHHLDFYRQSNPQDWQGGGLRDLITERAIAIIEWPEHAAGLPPADIDIWIDWADQEQACGPRHYKMALYQRPDGFDMAPFLHNWQTKTKLR